MKNLELSNEFQKLFNIKKGHLHQGYDKITRAYVNTVTNETRYLGIVGEIKIRSYGQTLS